MNSVKHTAITKIWTIIARGSIKGETTVGCACRLNRLVLSGTRLMFCFAATRARPISKSAGQHSAGRQHGHRAQESLCAVVAEGSLVTKSGSGYSGAITRPGPASSAPTEALGG